MKNTLYLDIEDDITAIIAKLKKLDADSVKIVPAKRSTVFTSVVNLKLLKKAAEDYDKEFAIITENNHLQSLASELDIKVAKSVKAAPSVPERKESVDLPSTTISADTPDETDITAEQSNETPQDNKNKTKGLAGFSLFGFLKKGKKSDSGEQGDGKGVPNFRKFRKKLIFGVILLALATGGIVYALFNAPQAVVTLEAQTRTTQVDFEFIADSEAEVADTEKLVAPAKAETVNKTATSKFTPTGERNVGDKATGTITIENCFYSDNSEPFVAGTEFRAPDGKVFSSTSSFIIEGAQFEGECSDPGVTTVTVVAEERGDVYNLAPTNYDILNYDEPSSDFSVSGGQMSGGSTEIVKVVTQSDVDNARQALLAKDIEQSKLEFANRFEEEVLVLDDSFTQTVDSVNSSPKVGQQLPEGDSEATLTIELTYFQFALETNQLEILLQSQLESELEEGEKVTEDGIDKAQIELVTKISDNQQKYSFETEPVIGPDVDEDALATEIAGMGYSEAIEYAEQSPHITKALVDLSPFWVFSIPDDPKQITVEIEIIE